MTSSSPHLHRRRLRRLLAVAALAPCLAAAVPAAAGADLELPSARVTPPGAFDGGTVDLAPGLDGSTHVLYPEAGGGFTTRRRAADGTLGPERSVSAKSGSNGRLAAEPSGALQVAWREHDGANYVVRTRRVAADGVVGATETLSSAGFDAYAVDMRVDGKGQATFVWSRSLASGMIVQARRRFADGTLSPVQNVSVATQFVDDPAMDVDAAGNVQVVWTDRGNDGPWTVRARRWSAAGGLGPIQDVSAGANSYAKVAMAEDGDAHVVWEGGHHALTRRIGPTGVLGEVKALGDPTGTDSEISVTMHPAGGVQAVWRADGAGGAAIRTRRIDAAGVPEPVVTLGPYAKGVDASTQSATPAVAVTASGDVTGVWRTIASLGQEQMAVKARTQRATGELGPLQTVFVQATPGYESVKEAPEIVAGPTGPAVAGWGVVGLDGRVEAAAGRATAPAAAPAPQAPATPEAPTPGSPPVTSGGPAKPPTQLAVDPVAPWLSGLTLAQRRIRVAGRLKVSFTLSEPARVTLTAGWLGGGRTVGGACRPRTRANAGRRSCDLPVPGALRVAARAGRTTVRLNARFRGRALRPGRYELVGRATTADGRVSAPVRSLLTVVLRRR
jgi:hypothetical protein